MSKRTSTKTSSTLSPTEDIGSLQERLLKSINSVFEPVPTTISKDSYSTTDNSKASITMTEKDFSSAVEEQKNPYQSLTEKAKAYVRQKEAELPKKDPSISKKPEIPANKKDKDTFLTGIGLEKTKPETPPEEESDEEEDVLPQIDDNEVIEGVKGKDGEYDDLEELRRMIRQTKKDMTDYGQEILDLKNIIGDLNDFAGRELGYSASAELMHSMENTLQDLRQNHSFKFMKKSNSSVKNLKAPVSSTTTNERIPTQSSLGSNRTAIKSSTTGGGFLPANMSKAGNASLRSGVRSFGVQKK